MFCGKSKGKCGLPHFLITLSGIALVMAALVSLIDIDLWLAGTQWILVAIALAVYAIAVDVHHGSGCGSSNTCSKCGCKEGECECEECK
ncbi:hypothetical protein ACFL3M_01810 [Patescibacteria group bacterium]